MAVYTYAGNRRKWDFTSSLLLDTGVRVYLGQHAEFGANDYAQLSPHYLLAPGAVAVDMSQFPWFDPNDVDGSVAHGDPAPAPFYGYVLLDASGYIDPSYLPPGYGGGGGGGIISVNGKTGQHIALDYTDVGADQLGAAVAAISSLHVSHATFPSLWSGDTLDEQYLRTGAGVSDIDGLLTELSNRSLLGHQHEESDIVGLIADLSARALVGHQHQQDDVAGLVADLSNRSLLGHTHPQSDVTNLIADLSLKSPVGHVHAQSQVTGLAADLAGKAPLASPALTGTPTAPTAPPGTDSTQIATTAFVLANAPSATVVSTVPATTGLDPASTDVEKALTELAARPSGGSAPITKPKVPYGSYLSPQINSMWSTPGGAYVWWVPLSVECPQAFDAIGLIVQSAGAGVTADFALVGDAGGYPGTVLGSSTGVSLTTATDASKVGAFSAVSLPVGLVWMAVRIADPNNNCQVTSAANIGQQSWGVPYTHFRDLPPYPHPGSHTSYGGAYKSATVLSSIPTTAPSGMVGLARNSPLPGLRAASW